MSIYDAAKDFANVLFKAGKLEEYRKIQDLIDDLYEKREEIEKLKEENQKLKDVMRVLDDYVFENNSYWHKETKVGPFCSRCLDKDRLLIRIIPNFINNPYATCPECEVQVNYTGREEKVKTSSYNDF